MTCSATATRRLAWIALSVLASFHFATAAQEPTWPSKPVRIIVPGGSGGVIDIRARWLAERLTTTLGVNVIVENKPGAGGNLGMEIGARSSPDGYTLIIIHQGVMTVNPHLYSRTGYDPLSDFVPITQLGVGPLLLAVNLNVQANTVAELVQLAKAKPGQLNFGSPGIGTPPHMAGELFKRTAGIDTVHVPYKGGGHAVTDLIGGHISYSIEGLTVQLPQVRAGRLRPLAVTSPKRIESLPDVPTMAEAGFAGAEFQGWVGIAAPVGTPKTVVARLFQDISGILATSEARTWLADFGAEARADSPEAFAAAIRVEYAKWGRVIKDAGIKLD